MKSLAPHPNVVQLLGVTPPPNFWIVAEFLHKGSLYSLLHSKDEMPTPLRRQIARGIASGMAHLHESKIIHRDLAARNILLSSNFDPKISDFGLSRFAEEDENKTKSDVGPIKWMAPEAIKDKKFSAKTDVWSYGVTLWEIIARSNPYPQQDLLAVATAVVYKGLHCETPPGTDQTFSSILDWCFQARAEDRPTMKQIEEMLT